MKAEGCDTCVKLGKLTYLHHWNRFLLCTILGIHQAQAILRPGDLSLVLSCHQIIQQLCKRGEFVSA